MTLQHSFLQRTFGSHQCDLRQLVHIRDFRGFNLFFDLLMEDHAECLSLGNLLVASDTSVREVVELEAIA